MMTVNLQKISGLPISFDEKRMDLNFNGDFPYIKKSERTLEELKPYLSPYGRCPEGTKNPPPPFEKGWGIKSVLNPVYRVWRYANLAADNEKINSHNLRYDLTLMQAGTIDSDGTVGVDGEFVKTAGHYHKKPYPEIYEVLMGRAYFLIQSESLVYLAKAGPGEKFIIPPSFGHNTINVFNEALILANWVSEKAAYDYEPYKKHHGAMYYFLKNNDLIDIVKNPNYESVPEIKKIRAREYPEFGLTKNRPLYSLVNNIEKLRFLNYPEEFSGEWRNW